MSENISTTIKRHESTAEFWKTKADREWAYAVNGQGGHHYNNAKQAYEKAAQFQDKANNLRVTQVANVGEGSSNEDKIVGSGLSTGIGSAAKVGCIVSGGIALAESIINDDNLEDTAKNVSSNALNGAASTTASALAGETVMLALNEVPLPPVAKLAVTTGMMLFTGTVVSDVIEDVCDDVGMVVGTVVSDITDGVENFLDALFNWW